MPLPRHLPALLALVVLAAWPAASLAGASRLSPATPPSASADSTRRLDTLRFWSAHLRDTARVALYAPAAAGGRPVDAVVLVNTGEFFFGPLRLPTVLDSLHGRTGRRILAVGLPDLPRGIADTLVLGLVRDELLPALRARSDLAPASRPPLLLGFSSGANEIVNLAAHGAGLFGRAAAMTPGWMEWDNERQAIVRDVTDATVRRLSRLPASGRRPHLWVAWGDARSEWESRSRANGARIVAALRRGGAAVETPAPVPGDHGLRLAKDLLGPALEFLLADPEPVRPGT